MSDVEELVKRLNESVQRHLRFQSSTDGPEAYIEHEATTVILAQQSTITTLRAERDEAVAAVEWTPTHRHLKSGGYYKLISGEARIEATLQVACVYENSLRQVWIRPRDEFFDGRFELLKKGTQHE